MIRMTRICSFGRNNWIIPAFSQRAVSPPKQIFVEYSAIASNKKKSEINERNSFKSKAVAVSSLTECYKEIKYHFLREIFQGRNDADMQEEALRSFFVNINNFSPPEIIKVLKVLAEMQFRPSKSLNTFCHFIMNQNWSYSANEIADLLFALARLSGRNMDVIKTACENLKFLNHQLPPRLASNILLSLGELRYRDTDLINNLLNYVENGEFSAKYSLNCLKACSILNYSSPEVVNLIKVLADLKEVDFLSTKQYLTFVWCSVILHKGDLVKSHIKTILSEDFIFRILNSYSGGILDSIKLKMLHINAAAHYILNESKTTLQIHPQFKDTNMPVTNKNTFLLKSVQDSLSYIIPKNGTIKSLLNTGAGFYLDLIYYQDVKKSNLETFGIVLLQFKDICSDNTLTGFPAFKKKILNHMGYKIIFIKETEYLPTDSLSEKIAVIKEKLKELEGKHKNSSVANESNKKEG